MPKSYFISKSSEVVLDLPVAKLFWLEFINFSLFLLYNIMISLF